MGSVEATLNMEVDEVKEKFIIKKSEFALRKLKDEMKKAKTIWINDATTDFEEKVNDTFSEDAEVRVLLFPGQKKTVDKNVQFREADVKIVCLIRTK
jgi:hypothetical protein